MSNSDYYHYDDNDDDIRKEVDELKKSKLVFFPCLPPYKPINDVITLNCLLKKDEEDIPPELQLRNHDSQRDHDRFVAGLFHVRYVKPFEKEEPEYPNDNDIPVFGPVKVGEKFDVISMLTSNGSRDYLVRNDNDGERVLVETLGGKYIIVCCFFVPMLADSYDANKCLNIIAAYINLILERRDEIQMVMVAKMRRDSANHEPDFQHFFSAFPCSCLAIPFWDSQSRDCVAKSLGLHGCPTWPTTIIVDPKQTVLQQGSSMDSLFKSHGALTFPFTAERIYSLSMEDRESRLRINDMNLDELLCLKTSDYLWSSDDENGSCMSVLDLSNKVVGLYMCYDGGYLTTINFFHEKCKAKGLEFEIVMVYLPFAGPVKWLQSRVNEALVKHEISWWVLPFNDKVSRRLSRLFSDYYHRNDKMIILGPNNSFAEKLGLEVMCCYGIKGYPFARECIVDRKFAKLRSLTLESVLLIISEEHNYVLDKDGDRVPVSELLGRNIILYLDYLDPTPKGEVYDQLVNWYPKLKAKDPEFEVVFISYGAPRGIVDERFYKMPWLSVPFPSGHSEHVNIKQLFLEWEDKYPTLIAFGKDGLLRSRCANLHLKLDGIDAFPFEGYLRREMFLDFNELNHFFY